MHQLSAHSELVWVQEPRAGLRSRPRTLSFLHQPQLGQQEQDVTHMLLILHLGTGERGGEGGCECHQSWTCMGRGRSQRPAFGSWTPPGDRCRELFPPASCRVSVQPSWQARPASSLGPCMPVAGPEESTGASTHTVSQSPGATHRALEVGSGRGTGSAARRPPSHAPDTAPTEGAEL